MKKLIFGVIIALTISCKKKIDQEFSLSGSTNGFKNGDVVYIDYNNKTIDSTTIENNMFVFNTKLPIHPINLWVHNKDFSNYRSFWAENNPMLFDASKNDFRNAKITGSETEKLSFDLYKKIDTLPRNERLNMEMKFVKDNPNSIISASILAVYSSTWGKEKTKMLFEKLSAENKTSLFGKEINKYIELCKEPKIGDQFADFEMKTPNGTLEKISNIKNKVILLEFWASWCTPCRKENPNLAKTYKEFNPKGFEIFAVSLDANKKKWENAINEDGLNWLHVSDLKGQQNEASLIYGINSVPDNFLIAKNGEIIGRNLRGDQLNKRLEELLK